MSVFELIHIQGKLDVFIPCHSWLHWKSRQQLVNPELQSTGYYVMLYCKRQTILWRWLCLLVL